MRLRRQRTVIGNGTALPGGPKLYLIPAREPGRPVTSSVHSCCAAIDLRCSNAVIRWEADAVLR
ncbi:hypothetical protein GCM10009414_08270 [Tatumella terrea]